ncbi:MAG: cytochrome c [Gammaproteobacteria bacterium]|nr:cytochrome c [Gammaproteobacteria bacterium]
MTMQKEVFGLRFPATVFAVFLLAGCGEDGHDHPEISTGRELFEYHCGECHQETGEGAFLRGIPPVVYTTMTYRQLVAYIRGHGRAEDTRMPAYSSMPKAEAEKIAIYVRRKLKAR